MQHETSLTIKSVILTTFCCSGTFTKRSGSNIGLGAIDGSVIINLLSPLELERRSKQIF